MTLRIENNTDWDGRDLRRLCRRVIEHTDGHFDRTIEVRTSRRRKKNQRWESFQSRLYHGRASVGSRRLLYMGVPAIERDVNGTVMQHEFDCEQFARVLEHEILHQQGLRHGEMTDDVRYCYQDLRFDVSDITVRPKPSYTPTA